MYGPTVQMVIFQILYTYPVAQAVTVLFTSQFIALVLSDTMRGKKIMPELFFVTFSIKNNQFKKLFIAYPK